MFAESTAVSIVQTFISLIPLLKKNNNNVGTLRKVKREIAFNAELLLNHFDKKSLAIDEVIRSIKTKELQKALDEGFNFKKLVNGKIRKKHTQNVPFYNKYEGMDCEEFLETILNNIEQLKFCAKQYGTNPSEVRVNYNARILNLGKKYRLFYKFLIS